MVWRLPIELLEQFECESFLSLEAKWIDGIQLIDGSAFYQLLQELETTIEVGAELAGERAIVEGLGKFAPRNFSFGDEHEAAHAAARSIGGHGGRGVASGGAGDPAASGLASEGGGNRHACVFKRAGGIHALMLGVEARYACDA